MPARCVWQPPGGSSGPVTGYVLERKRGTGAWTRVNAATPAALTYQDATYLQGDRYRVAALTSSGQGEYGPVTTAGPTLVPWMLTLDNASSVLAQSEAGLQPSVSGPDMAMRNTADLVATVNGGYRGYGFLNTTWDKDQVWRDTVESLCYRRSLQSLWWGGSSTADRYNLPRYQQMAAGDFDARAVEWVNALPIGTAGPGPKRPATGAWYQFYAALMHEPDIYTDLTGLTTTQVNATKDAYKVGVQRLIRVMVQAAQAKGAHPYEFAVGGLLAASDPDTASDWRWWEGMDSTTKASGLVGHFWDEYFEHSTAGVAQSFRTRVDARVAEFEAEGGWGLIRPVVAETSLRWHAASDTTTYTIVGTNDSALVWEAEVLAWLEDGPGEGFAFYNASETTPSATGSYFRPERFAWRLQHTANHKRLNRRGGGHPGELGAYPLPAAFQP